MFGFLNPKPKFDSISMDDFYQKFRKEKLNVIDVRGVEEFRSGHIQGAKNVPLNVIQGFDGDKDKIYYIICQSGVRTQKAAAALTEQGYQVIAVQNGMNSWQGKVVKN